jgi:TPR repeat protein
MGQEGRGKTSTSNSFADCAARFSTRPDALWRRKGHADELEYGTFLYFVRLYLRPIRQASGTDWPIAHFACEDSVCNFVLSGTVAPRETWWCGPAARGTIMSLRKSRSTSLSLILISFLMTQQRIPAVTQVPQAVASAFSDLESRAEQGDSGAQYQLALSILDRNPSPDDVQTAFKWLRASVAQNNPNAAFYLGYFYEHGKFVPQGYGLAFQNYEIATRAHYPPAENNLAFLYQYGRGVRKNPGKAYEWYLAAAQHGDPVGQYNLAGFCYSGTGTSRNSTEAVRWLRASADSGLAEAENSLAAFYFYGISVQRDYTEAARLVRLAVQKGLPVAATSLGFLYEHGKGVPLDYVAAYAWYSRATTAGDTASNERRKHLAQIMTRKQLDEANALATAQPPAQSTMSSITAFSPDSHH